MFNLDDVLKLECQFVSSFTDVVNKPYGVIYFNANNPLSHDSNHAHIFDLSSHLQTCVEDIYSFYTDQGIIPRIRTSFIDNEKELLFPILTGHNFKIESINHSYMLCKDSRAQKDVIKQNKYRMFRIEAVTAEVEQIIYSDSDGDWGIKVLKRHLSDPCFHLLGLAIDGVCLAIASFKLMNGYSRVDDVLVHSNHRRTGLGTELLSFLVNYHVNISNNHLYLYTGNDNAIGMYEKAGFKIIAHRESWSAYA